MSRHQVSEGDRAEAAEFRRALLGRLGLPTDAGDGQIVAAHHVLAEFFELAPHKVNSWAAAQTADVDVAFALLRGPEYLLISAGKRALRVQHGLDETPERHGSGPKREEAP